MVVLREQAEREKKMQDAVREAILAEQEKKRQLVALKKENAQNEKLKVKIEH